MDPGVRAPGHQLTFLPPEAGRSPPEKGQEGRWGPGTHLTHLHLTPSDRASPSSCKQRGVRTPQGQEKGTGTPKHWESLGTFNAEGRSFPPRAASESMGPLPQPPGALCPPRPCSLWPQLLRCYRLQQKIPAVSPASGQPCPSSPLPHLTHTEPHVLLISPWSQDGQSWCQGCLWALLRDLCRLQLVLGQLFPAPPSPLSPSAQPPALSGCVVLRHPKDWGDRRW